MYFAIETGGERGIRTPGTFYSTPDFESGTLNRSDISPSDKTSAKVKKLVELYQLLIVKKKIEIILAVQIIYKLS